MAGLCRKGVEKKQHDRQLKTKEKKKNPMKTKKQELIGVITVVDSNQELQKIVVSQDIVTHYSGETSHTKNLHLNTVDGVKVYKTEDPDIFKLPDGATLRKRNFSRSSR